jgi:hypothetical protein
MKTSAKSEAMDERRKAQRFPMKLPIQFGGGKGTTRDISGVGVYFETDYPFDAGSEIDFVLLVPDAINVRCRGTIVRIDPQREHFGIAATIDSYTLDTSQQASGTRPHIIIEELRKRG